MNLKPLSDRVLVHKEPADDMTEGGIVIPDTARGNSDLGTVIACGPGKRENGHRLPMTCKTGDTVVVARYAGTETEVDGRPLFVLRDEDVLAVIDRP